MNPASGIQNPEVGGGTRWWVVAGAILALNWPALELLSLRSFGADIMPAVYDVSRDEARSILTHDTYFQPAPGMLLYGLPATLPLLGAFAPLRRNRWVRNLMLSAFLGGALLLAMWMFFEPALGALSVLLGGIVLGGCFVVSGQLCARLGTATAAATARLFVGLILGGFILAAWHRWKFSPYLLGSWAGMGGSLLIIVGEWKGLRSHPEGAREPTAHG